MTLSSLSSPSSPLSLAQALIRCVSVTPEDNGAMDVLEQALQTLGFTCHRLSFGGSNGQPEIRNLYARRGSQGPHLCFAGHTDVVPPGQGWHDDPFAATVKDGFLYGRGACDMKAAIAAFICAITRYMRETSLPGSVSLLITGDEEGPATHGTVKVLEWLKARREHIDACLVGEPTNPSHIGEAIKIGRRGSLNGHLTVTGTQGHVAYPHLADNPLPRLITLAKALTDLKLDDGSPHFDPSSLVLTSIDVGNPTSNVIPDSAHVRFNVRFNTKHNGRSLSDLIRKTLIAANGTYGEEGFTLSLSVSGEAFLTPPGDFTTLIAESIYAETGRRPELSTSGGTSDARFIKDICPVVEFGLVNASIHKANEQCRIEDLDSLTAIYHRIISGFFAPA